MVVLRTDRVEQQAPLDAVDANLPHGLGEGLVEEFDLRAQQGAVVVSACRGLRLPVRLLAQPLELLLEPPCCRHRLSAARWRIHGGTRAELSAVARVDGAVGD